MPTSLPKLNKLKPSTERRAKKKKTPSAFVLSQAEIENELRKHGSGFTGGKQRIMALYQTQPDRKLRARLWQRSTESVGTPTIIWMAAEGLSTTTGEEWNLTITPNTRNSR